MAMIPDQDKKFLEDKFNDELIDQVNIIAFTSIDQNQRDTGLECEFCKETEDLLNEVAGISDKISVEIKKYSPDDQMAKDFGIDKVPAIVLMNNNSPGVKYYGIPGGYEFSSFIEDIIDISRNVTGLSKQTKERIHDIDEDVHIQVFVTPMCPYCPSTARIAHQMAIENPGYIKADVISASEFPDLVEKYDIKAVPTIIINEDFTLEGAYPEEAFANEVLSAAA